MRYTVTATTKHRDITWNASDLRDAKRMLNTMKRTKETIDSFEPILGAVLKGDGQEIDHFSA